MSVLSKAVVSRLYSSNLDILQIHL